MSRLTRRERSRGITEAQEELASGLEEVRVGMQRPREMESDQGITKFGSLREPVCLRGQESRLWTQTRPGFETRIPIANFRVFGRDPYHLSLVLSSVMSAPQTHRQDVLGAADCARHRGPAAYVTTIRDDICDDIGDRGRALWGNSGSCQKVQNL